MTSLDSEQRIVDEAAGRDRRSQVRHEIEGLQGTLSLRVWVRLVNISLGGMAVESPFSLEPGDRYRVILRNSDEVLQLSGSIVWCNAVGAAASPDGDDESKARVFHAGLQFEDLFGGLSKKSCEGLQQLLSGGTRRLFQRFPCCEELSLELARECPVDVCNLSLGGMLLEASIGDLPASDWTKSATTLEVRLPDVPTGLKGLVVHSARLGSEVGRSRVGMRFVAVPDSHREALAGLLSHHAA